MIIKLNETNLKTASEWLAGRDRALARVLELHGYPPLWAREPGFSTLVHIVLEQQVSLASANAAFQRLQRRLGGVVSPGGLLSLDDEALRADGFSRQKARYARGLAEAVLSGRLDLPALETQSDDAVRAELCRHKGIGNWTADIYLSECLLRPDILPQGDIAMQEAFRVLQGWPARPTHLQFIEHTEHWRPWRSIGARLLWHFYLNGRR
jgi:DNA-3-methyladenine glycosylase II